MAIYQCICCGTTREAEAVCGCPNCGYKMYPAPYDRREMMIREIRNFISHLRVTRIAPDEITIRREDDAARFPDFEKIQGYVCAADKTEKFIGRLNTCVEEIRKHLHTPFQAEYDADTKPLLARVAAYDAVLTQAAAELKINVSLPDAKLPAIKLDYSELPDAELLPIADEIMDRLTELADKLRRFIRTNNIYGTAYREKSKVKPLKEKEHAAALRKVLKSLTETLNTRFTVDIFSDGTEEIQTMTKAAWNAISALLSVPILTPIARWIISGSTTCSLTRSMTG